MEAQSESDTDNFSEAGSTDSLDYESDDLWETDSEPDDICLGFTGQVVQPDFKWSKSQNARPNPVPNFSDNNCSPTKRLSADASAIDYFMKFVDDNLISKWCDWTDENAQQRRTQQPNKNKGKWLKPSIQEMKVFIAILLLVNYGLSPARMELLWSKKSEHYLFHTPGIWKVITEKRYRQIKRYFRVASLDFITDHQQSDKLCRVRPLITHLRQTFESNYVPGVHIAVDEAMIPFKGM